jgi:hypothetical protein
MPIIAGAANIADVATELIKRREASPKFAIDVQGRGSDADFRGAAL